MIVSETGKKFQMTKSNIYPKFKFPNVEHDIAVAELAENGKIFKYIDL